MYLQHRRPGFDPWVGRSPGEGNGNPLQFLPGKFYRQRSLVGYSPRGCKELDRIEQLTLVFILKEIETWSYVFHLSDAQTSEGWYKLYGRGCGSFYWNAWPIELVLGIYSIDIFAHMHYVSRMAKMSYHYL